MKSTGCCSWLFCCGRSSGDEDEETTTTENGTTTVVRKTTRNGGTTVTTTTTTYISHPSSTGGLLTPGESIAFIPRQPSNRTIINIPSKTKVTPVPISKPNSTPSTGNQFALECLNEHNRFRALHGCPPLKLNSNMSAIAKKWAIHLAKINTMRHSKNDKYGENLYMCSGFSIDGRKAVESWYNEINLYNYRRPGFSMKTGHFTQVIWKETRELGVGVEIRGNSTWVVANYDPPGNVATCYEENVPRLLR
ncbi:Golgi-associated plant pathogenesis-related protein 1-like [Episyrphus balteatus]|uniref:Golgi-associated plant pathogenesis-related protein 1-like n=1 Tax=Episyrphus balteatus TaxID=286459 RepID=UPI002486C13C|nr:Golgi-associated plant pathogenesis-related protein 1-like [Episyrphus balteatus]